LDDILEKFPHLLPLEISCRFGEASLMVDGEFIQFQFIPFGYLQSLLVMTGRDSDDAIVLGDIHRFICYDGDGLIDDGDDDLIPDELFVSPVFRMHCQRHISEDGFRSGRRYHQGDIFGIHEISDVVHLVLYPLPHDIIRCDIGLQTVAPIIDGIVLVYPIFLVEVHDPISYLAHVQRRKQRLFACLII
jgi:hypothetical protein